MHAFVSFNVLKLCVFCLRVCLTEEAVCWGRARGLMHPGERTGPKPHLPSLRPHPVLSWGVSVGDGFPGNEEAALCIRRVMQSGSLKVAREGGTK